MPFPSGVNSSAPHRGTRGGGWSPSRKSKGGSSYIRKSKKSKKSKTLRQEKRRVRRNRTRNKVYRCIVGGLIRHDIVAKQRRKRDKKDKKVS